MRFERWAAFSEIVSSVAIVITLGYLAIQTQQTNRSLQASSREATMLADVSILTAFMNNPEANLYQNATPGELSATQLAQLGNGLAALMRVREYAWLQKQAGVMDFATWESYASTAVRILSSPQGKLWWSTAVKQEFDRQFVEEVDRLIREYAVP